MDVASLITSLPNWLLFILVVALGVLAAETGARLAQKKVQKGMKEPGAPVSSAVGAILGLLAFVLGFTFAITSGRFADRKQLVVQQANAIGTCYLRTSFLPEQQKQETRRLLREYVNILINIQDVSRIEKNIARLEAIHSSLWSHTASLTGANMDPALRFLFISSVNEMMDLASERGTVSLVFRIPSILWVALFLLYALSMFALGYQAGNYKIHRIVGMFLLAGAIAMVVVVIAEMDSVGSRRFRVSEQPMKDVQKLVQQNIP